MKICTVICVRLQFVKAAVLSPVIRKEHKEILIHTGQHYDENMSDIFFHELGLPKPDYTLALEGGNRFDVSRLMKLKRQAILQKVSEKQEFDSGESCLGKIDNIVEGFEENVLCVLWEFEKDMKK